MTKSSQLSASNTPNKRRKLSNASHHSVTGLEPELMAEATGLSEEQLLELQQTMFQQPIQFPAPDLAQPFSQVLHAVGTEAAAVSSKPTSPPHQLDKELVHGLSSWVRCAALLGQVAASVAAQACCLTVQARQAEEAPATSSQQDHTGRRTQQQQASQDGHPAEQALRKVMQDLGMSEAALSPAELPVLKRRNSGKRNLHRPWTATEEEQLVRLVEQADFRKEVLGVHRLTAGAWAKIGRHLGRSGASGLQAIQGKYRSLKQRTPHSPSAQPSPDPLTVAARQLQAAEQTPAGKEGRRSKLTACALAILGLQSLPEGEGTCKHILAAIDSNPGLVPHLNWEADQNGKIRWRSGVTSAVSADKAGIFQKTGVKQGGQIIWRLDTFKAEHELSRHANLPQSRQNMAANVLTSS